VLGIGRKDFLDPFGLFEQLVDGARTAFQIEVETLVLVLERFCQFIAQTHRHFQTTQSSVVPVF